MTEDIRDKPFLRHDDILNLNFIRSPGGYFYRRHYRAGLRSHIMEVLKREEWELEEQGIVEDKLTRFPRARPIKMLRLFRTRFRGLDEAEEELRRVKVILSYLGPRLLATSEEFLVSYQVLGQTELLLCGLQEYVEGEIVDPWARFDDDRLAFLFTRFDLENQRSGVSGVDQWIRIVREKAKYFIEKNKEMILGANLVPDLAGIGNLLLTRNGDIKLVDINNVSNVSFGNTIQLDDRGYPVCDKSIEALFRLEQEFVGPSIPGESNIYKVFLDPQRMKEVNAIQEAFHEAIKS
jgi:hypothetical protein